jgi:hypothetical protein
MKTPAPIYTLSVIEAVSFRPYKCRLRSWVNVEDASPKRLIHVSPWCQCFAKVVSGLVRTVKR